MGDHLDPRPDHHAVARPRGQPQAGGRPPPHPPRAPPQESRPRLARFQLQQRRQAKAALLGDPVVREAIAAHAAEHRMSDAEVRRRVETYIAEIVPHFSILSYYKVGYNLAKALVNLLYKVSVDYQDEAALARIPKKRSEEHTSELQSRLHLVCRLLLEKKKSVRF